MRRTDGSDGGSAFPTTPIYTGDVRSDEYDGMSLRDYFAAKAMQAVLSNPSLDLLQPDDLARDAYNLADAMLLARDK